MLKKRKTRAARVVEVLVAARKLIARKGGWTQGQVKDSKTGAVCALGAIRTVTKKNRGIRRAAFECLQKVLPVPYRYSGSVISYNDHPRRRQSAVVKLFDRAIKEAKKNAKIQAKIK